MTAVCAHAIGISQQLGAPAVPLTASLCARFRQTNKTGLPGCIARVSCTHACLLQVAEGLFKRARKLRRAVDAVQPLLEAAQQELEYLESVSCCFC